MERLAQDVTFSERPFRVKMLQHGEQDFSVELWELEPNLTLCYAADFLEEVEAEIEVERILDDIAAFA